MSYSWVYVPVSNKKEGLKLARVLVGEKLVACANVFDHVTSVYEWKGKVEESPESVMIAKTRSEKFNLLKARVEELHSYTCPCVISLPIENGNEAYLKWIFDQTSLE